MKLPTVPLPTLRRDLAAAGLFGVVLGAFACGLLAIPTGLPPSPPALPRDWVEGVSGGRTGPLNAKWKPAGSGPRSPLYPRWTVLPTEAMAGGLISDGLDWPDEGSEPALEPGVWPEGSVGSRVDCMSGDMTDDMEERP